jgi:hypothetical protein
MGKLVKFIIYFFKVGTILGIFRFRYDKKTKCFVKSRFLEIYSVIIWTFVLYHIIYLNYIFIDSDLKLTTSDRIGYLMTKLTFFGSNTTFCLSILAMFWCLFFGKANLLELANEGINLYRSVTIFKKYPRPSTDRFFWLLFIRNVFIGIPVSFLLSGILDIKENWCLSNIFKSLFLLHVDIIYTCFLDLKNIVFFVATHLLKLLRLELLTLNRNFKHNPKLLAIELRRITKQIHKILNYLHKVAELLDTCTTAIFLYIFVDLTVLVTMD